MINAIHSSFVRMFEPAIVCYIDPEEGSGVRDNPRKVSTRVGKLGIVEALGVVIQDGPFV